MKTCLFCGPTTAPITGEDAWPLWIGRVLEPRLINVKATYHRAQHGKPKRTWTSTQMTQRVNDVCKVCNNGWMSGLEEQTIPLIASCMLDGTPKRWDFAAQYTLAIWAIKMAMVFEFVLPFESAGPFFTAAERASFMNSLEPPAITVGVWFGAYYDKGLMNSVNYRAERLSPTRVAKRNYAVMDAYVATFSIGLVSFQVASMRLNVDGVGHPPEPRGFSKALVSVFPTRDLRRWPPRLKFDNDGIETLCHRWDTLFRFVR